MDPSSAKHISWQSGSSQILMQKSILCIENKYLLRLIFLHCGSGSKLGYLDLAQLQLGIFLRII